ncbi:MAG: adenosylmethionine decarboxylase [Lachnospiraceae bacterium]|nr:adenosylmethionine decarboxylase [Lachnospiraceae bacterium]
MEEQKRIPHTAKQLVLDLYGCPAKCIDDIVYIKHVIHTICKNIGAGIVEECYHKFEPVGISGVAVITTSHMSIHTWPEFGYAAIDVFSCQEEITTEVCRQLEELLQAKKSVTRMLERKIGE